jgi:hypothetical protein
MWNVLMYFVPFILFSLSIGCLATALLGVLMAELAFWFEYAFEKLPAIFKPQPPTEK